MERVSGFMIGLGSAMVGGTIFLNSFFFTVDAGQRGIMLDRVFKGIKEKIYSEGMHFYIPLMQSPIIYETRLRPKTVASHTGTKDLQTVDIGLRLLYRPIEEFLPAIHNNLGIDYDDKILPSIANEVLKATVAQYDADQLLKMREKISHEVRESLTGRARDFNIALDDVSIIHLGFMKEYANAIEQKQVQQQYAER